jgi:gas vesicle protein
MAVGAILGIISSLIGAASAGKANKQSQRDLDALARNQRVPDAVKQGEELLRDLAYGDLPGYQYRLSDIESSQAQTINQAKDYVSGGGLLGALSEIYTRGNAAKRELTDTNAQYRDAAKNKLVDYLSRVTAGYDMKLQDDLNSIALAKVGVTQAGTQDKLNFMNTGLNAVSNDKGLLAIINKLLGNTSTTETKGT